MSTGDADATALERQARARRTAEARYGFRWNLAWYVIIDVLLVGVWFYNGHGFFWPAFVIVGWGIGVAANYWVAYRQSDKTWVDRETDKILAEDKDKLQ